MGTRSIATALVQVTLLGSSLPCTMSKPVLGKLAVTNQYLVCNMPAGQSISTEQYASCKDNIVTQIAAFSNFTVHASTMLITFVGESSFELAQRHEILGVINNS